MTLYRRLPDGWTPIDHVGQPVSAAEVNVHQDGQWRLVWPPETTNTAASSGSWSSPDTWEVAVPTDGATVRIPTGVTVTVDARIPDRIKRITVEGTLRFDPSINSRLRVETVFTALGSRFEIGTDASPVQPGVTAEIEFIDEGPIDETEDPDRVSKGLIVQGDLEIVGAETLPPWTTLAAAPTAGDTVIELSAAPTTGWDAGDELVIPGLEAYTSLPLSNTDEERTIAAIDGTTIELNAALDHDHVPPATDLDTYVLNLNRNVKFYSENTDIDRRGHVMVMSTETTIKNLETLDMGRTEKARDVTSPLWDRGEADPADPPNPRARYSIHFHRTGPTAPPHVVQGCVVRRDPGWAYTNHGSNALIEDNISYKVLGAGFVSENGTEHGTFKRNFALRSEGSGESIASRKGWSNAFANTFLSPPHNIDDFGHSGHGFWMQGAHIEVEGNVAAGHRHTPFAFWGRALHEEPLERDADGNFTEFLDGKHDMFPKVPIDILNDYEQTVGRPGDQNPPVSRTGEFFHDPDPSVYFTDSLPLRSFWNNVAFGCGGGFDIERCIFRNHQTELLKNDHGNNVIYNVAPLILEDGSEHHQANFTSSGNVGLDHRYTGWVRGRNYRLIGSGDGIGVYRNRAYIDGFDIVESTIENWASGVVPPAYKQWTESMFRDNDFINNDIDVHLQHFWTNGSGGERRTWYENNSYSGNVTFQWDEINEPAMLVSRVTPPHSGVTFERRTLCHGWSRPDFVFLQEGDDDRLRRDESNWSDLVGGGDPYAALEGKTHEQIYNEFGFTLMGGFEPAIEERADFGGSGGTYDSTPFLEAEKTQPCDVIWVDVVNHCSFSGMHTFLQHGDAVPNGDALQFANDQTVVELNRDGDESLPIGDSGVAEYTFEVDRDGTYQVYTRAMQGEESDSGNNSSNSRFYVRMDGGTWQLYDFGHPGGRVAPLGHFGWGARSSLDFDLTAGTHTIEIAGKGHHMRLDWVLIKHEARPATPHFMGQAHTL